MDYYDELGISKTATDAEIKRAYRRLAKTYHPDKNKTPEAEDKIRRVNEAYQILGDREKRTVYDRQQSNSSGRMFGNTNFDISDIFSNAFDFNKPRHQKHKFKKTFESQAKTTLTIDFIESILGVSDKIFTHIYRKECSSCNGYGGEFSACPNCAGAGVVNRSDGFISINTTCSKCHGTGKKIGSVCGICSGKGYDDVAEELMINIPEGLESRTKLFVKGKGNYINGSRGDLYIAIDIVENKLYSRNGNDIVMTIDVDILDVLLERTIPVQSFRGDFSIDLDPDTIHDPIILVGKGTKPINGTNYGDFIIKISPQIHKLTDSQKNILETML